jgi:hypothetical protein
VIAFAITFATTIMHAMCVLGISAGVAVACLATMLAQGFTLYDGAHVPPLLPSIDFTGLLDWWPWRRSA